MKKILAITLFSCYKFEKNLKNFKFDIITFHDIVKNPKIDFNKFDIVYVLNWPIYGYISHKVSRNRKYKLVTGVSSHVGRPNAKKMKSFFSRFDAIGVSNKFLLTEFGSAKIGRVIYTPFGVNHKIFKKITSPNDYKYIFGWVGNNKRSVKRYNEICKVFTELDPRYKLKTVDNTSGYSRERMAEFYNSIGTLICYSESEGTPNPVLEAAMCGRAIISSNVPELMSNIKDFTPVDSCKELMSAIEKHSNTFDLNIVGANIGAAALGGWTWEDRSKNFIKLFR